MTTIGCKCAKCGVHFESTTNKYQTYKRQLRNAGWTEERVKGNEFSPLVCKVLNVCPKCNFDIDERTGALDGSADRLYVQSLRQ